MGERDCYCEVCQIYEASIRCETWILISSAQTDREPYHENNYCEDARDEYDQKSLSAKATVFTVARH